MMWFRLGKILARQKLVHEAIARTFSLLDGTLTHDNPLWLEACSVLVSLVPHESIATTFTSELPKIKKAVLELLSPHLTP